ATFFPLLGAVTVAVWFLALRRASLQAHGRAVAGEFGRDRWALAAGVLVIVAIAAIRLTFSPLLHFSNSTAWRYWGDAIEVADAHHIPSQVLQYGAVFPSTVSKVFLNTLNAGVIFATGREPLPGMAAMLWIGSVGLAMSLWALGRELGLRFTAALLPVLLIVNDALLNREMTTDLTTYKAEIFGRLVAFAALAIAVRPLRPARGSEDPQADPATQRTTRWKDPLLAGSLFGFAAAMHLIPVIVAVIMLALYALVRLALDRKLWSVLRPVLVTGVALAAVGGIVLVLPHGDLGLRGAAGNEAYSGFESGFDPTCFVHSGLPPGQQATGCRIHISPSRAFQEYALSATGLTRRSTLGHHPGLVAGVLFVGGLAIALWMVLRFPDRLRPLGFVAWGLALATVVLTWLFSHTYHLYIPSLFGVRRLFDYSSVPIVLGALALIEGGFVVLARSRPAVTGIAAIVVVVVASALILPGAAGDPPTRSDRDLMAAFQWIRTSTPCNARFLTNEHTEGVFEALTGRVAVLEGATPYLRPDVLSKIVKLLLDARAFFEQPASNQSFLTGQGIDYVFVSNVPGVGYVETIGPLNRAALAGMPSLPRVFSNATVTIYRVTMPSGTTGFVDPSRFPGYHCARRTIQS
ncbi:MAG TPA: hypothetical protein VF972_01910, partial [Actinomycetota bacterium]